ncbi:MAG TPA: 16S rRNA (guanine(527)-N(7))-methyltransferase RsmG [Burkholderiales bacterium]|nr:16S rRNA (guanine(527)-N(7))-methyltransferase RsmG [Burkholderiales bacterium]
MQQQDYLIEQARLMDVSLSPAQAECLLSYLALIAKWNRVHNLTALREPDKMLSHHILDSLSIQPYITARNLLDVGSGAGLPGIPLAIADPGRHITVMDSNTKKTSFLRQAVLELNLKNVDVIAGRIENLSATHRFDGIVSRAFSDINQFVGMSMQVLEKGGRWYSMKGLLPEGELQQIPAGIEVLTIQPLNIPLLAAQRHLVIMKEADG